MQVYSMPSGSQNDSDVSKTDAPASVLSTIECLVEKTLQNVCAAMDTKRTIWKICALDCLS
jgi:hypothetical protein